MSALSATVKNLFQAKGLPIAPVMESTAALKNWFAQRDNKILPLIGNVVTQGRNVSLTRDGVSISVQVADEPHFRIAIDCCRAAVFDPASLPTVLKRLAQNIQKHQNVLALALSVDTRRNISEVRKVDLPYAVQIVNGFAVEASKWIWSSNAPSMITSEGGQSVWSPSIRALGKGVISVLPSDSSPLIDTLKVLCPALISRQSVLILSSIAAVRTLSILSSIMMESMLPEYSFAFLPTDSLPTNLHVDGLFLSGPSSLDVLSTDSDSTLLRNTRLNIEVRKFSVAVVLDSADLESAAMGVVEAAAFAGGRSPLSVSKVFVQESCLERFMALVEHRVRNLRHGSHLDKVADFACEITKEDLKIFASIQSQVESEGAQLVTSFKIPSTNDAVAVEEMIGFPFVLTKDVGLPSLLCTQKHPFPLIAVFPFRTLKEAVALCETSGPLASLYVWSENVGQCMEIAHRAEAPQVFFNTAIQLDASVSSGTPDVLDFLKLPSEKAAYVPFPTNVHQGLVEQNRLKLDGHTYSLFHGGNKKRPDAGSYLSLTLPEGSPNPIVVQIPEAGLKDMKSAIDAAVSASSGWSKISQINRASFLLDMVDRLTAWTEYFVQLLMLLNYSEPDARSEVTASIDRLKLLSAMGTDSRGTSQFLTGNCVIEVSNPLGVIGVAVPDNGPLISLVTAVGAALVHGNCVVIAAGTRRTFTTEKEAEKTAIISLEFEQIIERANIPSGVINILAGNHDELLKVCALHGECGAIWDFRMGKSSPDFVRALISAKKQRPLEYWRPAYDNWMEPTEELFELFERFATKRKAIWLPTVYSFAN